MKTRAAIAFEAAKPLVIDEIDIEGPKAGECLVRLAATGVCHTDAFTLSGADPEGLFPAVLGHENVGEVVEVGSAVDRQWLGRRVCVEPTLCCLVRGIDPPCPACAVGEYNACHHFAGEREGTSGLPAGTNLGRAGAHFRHQFVYELQLLHGRPTLVASAPA